MLPAGAACARLLPVDVDAPLVLCLSRLDTSNVYQQRPPICPACGVTMVRAELSAYTPRDHDWVCLECEETDGRDVEPARTARQV